ncbi:MAG: NHLP leader peptide family RiPP precursor [Firmicutes bacterium]|nr:NHLP leader peptide family RiPP precursor [Bacillota bacterium]
MERQELEQKLIKKAWEDSNFKKQLLSDPKAVLEKELGQALPEKLQDQAVEETSNTVYIRIPRNPEELSEDELDNVAGGLGLGTVIDAATGGGTENTCNNFSIISL